jgi:hypothetical protein
VFERKECINRSYKIVLQFFELLRSQKTDELTSLSAELEDFLESATGRRVSKHIGGVLIIWTVVVVIHKAGDDSEQIVSCWKISPIFSDEVKERSNVSVFHYRVHCKNLRIFSVCECTGDETCLCGSSCGLRTAAGLGADVSLQETDTYGSASSRHR